MDHFHWLYIGNGGIAETTARALRGSQHVISAVWGRNTAKAQAFARRHGAAAYARLSDALHAPGLDGVYIATPHTSHLEYARAAMDAGLPVLCEKPVGISLAQADALIAASNKNKVYFAEAMWTWFSPVALQVRQWVRDGEIGEIKAARLCFHIPGLLMPKSSRLRNPATAGGALLDIGIYPVAYCYQLFGAPRSVRCTGVIREGIDVRETVILDYGRFSCTLQTGLDGFREDCLLEGTKGTLRVPFFHRARVANLRGLRRETFRGSTDYRTEFDRAAEEIRAGKTESSFVSHEVTRTCIAILDECRRQMGLRYPFEM